MKKNMIRILFAVLLSAVLTLGTAAAVSAEESAGIFTWDLKAALQNAGDLNTAGGTSPFTVEQIRFASPSAETGTFSPMTYSGGNYGYNGSEGVLGLVVEPNNNCYVSPGCNTNNGICAAVAFGFTAPVSGTYTLKATATLRENNTSTDSDNLYGPTEPEWYTLKGKNGTRENVLHFHGNAGTAGNIEASYALKAGETFYLVSDPNGNHWNDNVYLTASVTLTKADTAGMAKPTVGSNLLGSNVIFADPSAAVDYNKEENHGILRFMGIDTKAGSLYRLDGLASDPNGGYAGNGIHFNNYAGPQVGLNAAFRAAAIAVIIPADGNYTLSTVLNRVNTSTDSAFTQSDVYVLNRGGKLYEEKFWHTDAGTSLNVTADLAAGDVLLLVSDPNGGENAWWEDTLSLGSMSFVCNSLADAGSGEETGEETGKETGEDIGEGTGEETGAADTGSILLPAVLVCLCCAAVLTVLKKRKETLHEN